MAFQSPTNSIQFRCLGCGDPGSTNLGAKNVIVIEGAENFVFARCDSCGSLRLLNPPGDLGKHYDCSRYYSLSPRTPLESLDWLLRSGPSYRGHGLFFRLLSAQSLEDPALMAIGRLRLGRSARILDVGCGNGRLLRRLHFLGFSHLYGIDPFCRAHREEGLEIQQSTLQAASYTEPFNLVMFHHSLEHVPDPEENLLAAVKVMEPDGNLIVRIPVLSRGFELYGARWHALDVPRHMMVPTSQGLQRLLARCGLRIVDSYFDTNEWEILCSSGDFESFGRLVSSQAGFLITKLFSRQVRDARRIAGEWNRLGLGGSVVVYATPK